MNDSFGRDTTRSRRPRFAAAIMDRFESAPHPGIGVIAALVLALSGAAPAHAEVSFSKDLAPIVLKRCAGCHGERAQLGGYRAHTFQALMKTGHSGKAPIVSGKPDASRLFQLLVEKSPTVRMPKSDDPLTPQQIGLFKQWITEGAKFDGPEPTGLLRSLLGPRRHPASPAAYRAPVPVLSLAFAPGGKELLSGGYHEVNVWDPTTAKLLRRIQRLPQRIQTLAFSPDGKRLLVAGGTPGEYGEVCLVEFASGKVTQVLDTFPDIVLSAAFNRDGSRVVAGGADLGVRAYDVAASKRLWSNRVHSDWVTGVSFSADGRFAASSSKDKTVKVFDAEKGTLFTTYNGHNKNYGKYRGQYPVHALQFTGDGAIACSAGGGPTVQIWDPVKANEENGTAADMEERFAKESHARHIEHGFKKEVFSLLVRGGSVFASSAEGLVKQFDLATQKEIRTYIGLTDWLFGLDFDPQSGRVAAGSFNGEVRVWDSRTGQQIGAFKAQPTAAIKQVEGGRGPRSALAGVQSK